MLSRKFLIDRGYCCGHGCLMCPYEPKHVKGNPVIVDWIGVPEEKKEVKFLDINKHKGLAWKDDDWKVIVIHTPKCASTTIRAHVLRGGPTNLDNNTIPNRGEFRLLTIMRNPITRFFSGVTAGLHSPMEVNHFWEDKYEQGTWKDKLLHVLEDVKNEKYFNIHIVPQVWFHKDLDGEEYGIDEYLKFEDLNNEILTKISDQACPVNTNASPIHEAGITNLYDDPDVLKGIREAYEEDFNCYLKNIGDPAV